MITSHKACKISSQTLEKQDKEIDIDLNIYKSSSDAIASQVLASCDPNLLNKNYRDYIDTTRTASTYLSLRQSNNVDLTFESEGYKVTRDRLISLLHEDDEEELKPTPYAFDIAWKFMTNAAKKLLKDFPRASVAANDEGGIRIRWIASDKNREVSLYCPSSIEEKAYIYYEIDDKYDVDYNSPDLTLAKWLTWLTQKQIG